MIFIIFFGKIFLSFFFRFFSILIFFLIMRLKRILLKNFGDGFFCVKDRVISCLVIKYLFFFRSCILCVNIWFLFIFLKSGDIFSFFNVNLFKKVIFIIYFNRLYMFKCFVFYLILVVLWECYVKVICIEI